MIENYRPAAPWERQEGETDAAYAAFCHYRDMEPGDRRVADVAPLIGANNTKGVYRWSAMNNWLDRTRAYDNYMTNALVTVRAADIDQYRDKVIEVETQITALVAEMVGTKLKHLRDKMIKDPEEVRTGELTSLVNTMDKLFRNMRRTGGMATSFKTQNGVEDADDAMTYFIMGNEDDE